MVAKVILILCAQALLAKFALSQCIGLGLLRAPCRTLGCDGVAPVNSWDCGGRLRSAGFGMNPSCGGNLMVTSSSRIAPTGLRITSENIIEGTLSVIGNLPFLGAVVTDGSFPTAGAGAVSYGCGDGSFGITAENINVPPAVAPIVPGIGYAAGITAYNLPYGLELLFRYRGRCGSGLY